ncbi:MAG: hypothetical protein WAV28_17235 [Sedimentisphaerales bacterium]
MVKKTHKIGACEWLEKIAHSLHFDAKKASQELICGNVQGIIARD